MENDNSKGKDHAFFNHTTKRKYQSSLCGKTFSCHSGITNHLRTHSGERTHQCSFCDKAFSSRENLVNHLKAYMTPSGHIQYQCWDTQYQCCYCDKIFLYKRNLKRHKKSHTHTDPDFDKCKACKCSDCDFKCNTQSRITEHIAVQKFNDISTEMYGCNSDLVQNIFNSDSYPTSLKSIIVDGDDSNLCLLEKDSNTHSSYDEHNEVKLEDVDIDDTEDYFALERKNECQIDMSFGKYNKYYENDNLASFLSDHGCYTLRLPPNQQYSSPCKSHVQKKTSAGQPSEQQDSLPQQFPHQQNSLLLLPADQQNCPPRQPLGQKDSSPHEPPDQQYSLHSKPPDQPYSPSWPIESNHNSKPPYSYPQLIVQAISSNPDTHLTVSGIYSYITQTYPYYRVGDKKRWQNHVRHTLSLSSKFIKMERQGLGCFWKINPTLENDLVIKSFKRKGRLF